MCEFSRFKRTLTHLHTFEMLFSSEYFTKANFNFILVSSNINAISISSDSQFAAIGSSNGDYGVKIIDLWEKKVLHDLNSLHTCKLNFLNLKN